MVSNPQRELILGVSVTETETGPVLGRERETCVGAGVRAETETGSREPLGTETGTRPVLEGEREKKNRSIS